MITVNIAKAREIAHTMRRAARSAEFAPLDIAATIPAQASAAESDRKSIRKKYATMQVDIDSAKNPDQIKAALKLDTVAPI